MPLSLVAMASFFVAVFTQDDPSGRRGPGGHVHPARGTAGHAIRQAAGELPLWEAALGIALVLATIAAAIPLAGRIYAGGALFTRGRLKLREAYARAGE
jgi:ABC-2 type transport system permease protein